MKKFMIGLTVLTIWLCLIGCNRSDPPADSEVPAVDVLLEELGFQCYRYSIITPDLVDLVSYRCQDLVVSGYIQDHTLQTAAFFDYTRSDQPYYFYGSLQKTDPAMQAQWEAFLQESGLQANDVIKLLQDHAEASYSPAQISSLLMDEQAQLDIDGNALTICINDAIIQAQYENGILKKADYRHQADAASFTFYPDPDSPSSEAEAYSDFLYSLGIIHSEWIDYLIDAASLIEAP